MQTDSKSHSAVHQCNVKATERFIFVVIAGLKTLTRPGTSGGLMEKNLFSTEQQKQQLNGLTMAMLDVIYNRWQTGGF